MLRKSKKYLSIVFIALMSLLIVNSVKACEEDPQTFLSLFMSSDLIVLAKYNNDGKTIKGDETEYDYKLDTPRNLLISKVYKGQQSLKSVSFLYTTYISKEQPTASEEDSHIDEGYFSVSSMKIGEDYIFFLSKNKETGKYEVIDHLSGVRKLNNNLDLYEQNLNELNQIVAAKGEEQYTLLTEWLVKNIENPLFSEDSIGDLAVSFNVEAYQNNDPKYKDKGPFVMDDGFGLYTVGVAKRLSPSQKDRISKVLYSTIQEAWSSETPKYVSYGVSVILRNIDKPRLVLYAHNALKNVEKSNFDKRRVITEFLSDSLGDETFTTIHYDIAELIYKLDDLKREDSPNESAIKETMTAIDAKSAELEKRFQFMQARSFVVVEES